MISWTAVSAQRREVAAAASGTDGPIAPDQPAVARRRVSARPAVSGSGMTMRGCSLSISSRIPWPTAGATASRAGRISTPTAMVSGSSQPTRAARSASVLAESPRGSIRSRSMSWRWRRSRSLARRAAASA